MASSYATTGNLVNYTITSSSSSDYVLSDWVDFSGAITTTKKVKKAAAGSDGDDPIAWLRRRVEEVCFQPGA